MSQINIESRLQDIHHTLSCSDKDLVMNQTFRSQGYDSLDDVEFFIQTEKEFGVSIDDTILSNVQTPNDVVELIRQAIV